MSDKAEALLAGLGGKDNVRVVEACITRLRVEVADPTVVDEDALREAGSFGVVLQGGVVQVVIGPEVDELAAAMNAARGQ